MKKPEILLADLAAADASIRALASRLVRDDSDAEDVAQDAWIRALENPPRPDRPVRRWITSVVRNLVIARHRSSAHRVEREHATAKSEALPSVADAWGRERMRRTVADAVFALEEPYRSTIVYRYFESLPPREIAERLGVSSAAVEGRLRRGLEKLRARLDREFGDRRSWCAALLPLIGQIPAPVATAAGSATTASILTGALVMSTKIKIGIGIAAVLVAATAVAFWPRDEETSRPGTPLVEEKQPSTPAARIEEETRPRTATALNTPVDKVVVEKREQKGEAHPRFCVYGRVVSQEGKAIGEATVRLMTQNDCPPPGYAVQKETQTKTDGTFDFGKVEPRLWFMEAAHPSFCRLQKRWWPGLPDGPMEFRLERGGAISGVVRRGGKEIEGVWIVAGRRSSGFRGIESRTESNGRYTLPGLCPGEYDIAAKPGDGASPLVASATVKSGHTTELDLVVPAKVRNRVEGSVTDSRTGQPLPGVTVFVHENNYHKAITDANGRFVLESVQGWFQAQRVNLRAVKEGLVYYGEWILVHGESNIRHDFSLTQAGRVSGRVVDSTGCPVPYPRVALHEANLNSPEHMTVGDSEGRYTCGGARPGNERHVFAIAEGMARGRSRPFRLEPGQHQIDVVVVLGRGSTLDGRVCAEDGTPAEGVRVLYLNEGIHRESAHGETATDRNGRFKLTQLMAGRCEITVRAADFASVSDIVTIPVEGRVEREWLLSRGMVVAGRITDARGVGVSARLRLFSEPKSRPACFRTTRSSKESGGFRIEGLPPGRYRLRVEPENELYARTEQREVRAGTLDLWIRLEAKMGLSGKLGLPNGEGAPEQLWVLCQRVAEGGTPGESVGRYSSWNQGEFTVELTTPGVYRVVAGTVEGLVTDTVRMVQIPNRPSGDATVWPLVRGATIRGKIEVEGGAMADGIEVTLLRTDGFRATLRGTRRIDRNGTFVFAGVPAGLHRIEASTRPETGVRGSCLVAVSGDRVDIILKVRDDATRPKEAAGDERPAEGKKP